jgi:hypothetical protein
MRYVVTAINRHLPLWIAERRIPVLSRTSGLEPRPYVWTRRRCVWMLISKPTLNSIVTSEVPP